MVTTRFAGVAAKMLIAVFHAAVPRSLTGIVAMHDYTGMLRSNRGI